MGGRKGKKRWEQLEKDKKNAGPIVGLVAQPVGRSQACSILIDKVSSNATNLTPAWGRQGPPFSLLFDNIRNLYTFLPSDFGSY